MPKNTAMTQTSLNTSNRSVESKEKKTTNFPYQFSLKSFNCLQIFLQMSPQTLGSSRHNAVVVVLKKKFK